MIIRLLMNTAPIYDTQNKQNRLLITDKNTKTKTKLLTTLEKNWLLVNRLRYFPGCQICYHWSTFFHAFHSPNNFFFLKNIFHQNKSESWMNHDSTSPLASLSTLPHLLFLACIPISDSCNLFHSCHPSSTLTFSFNYLQYSSMFPSCNQSSFYSCRFIKWSQSSDLGISEYFLPLSLSDLSLLHSWILHPSSSHFNHLNTSEQFSIVSHHQMLLFFSLGHIFIDPFHSSIIWLPPVQSSLSIFSHSIFIHCCILFPFSVIAGYSHPENFSLFTFTSS